MIGIGIPIIQARMPFMTTPPSGLSDNGSLWRTLRGRGAVPRSGGLGDEGVADQRHEAPK